MSDVRDWLNSLGLGQYADAFEDNAVELSQLVDLDHEVLLAIGVAAAGHRMRILKAAAGLPPSFGQIDGTESRLPTAVEQPAVPT